MSHVKYSIKNKVVGHKGGHATGEEDGETPI